MNYTKVKKITLSEIFDELEEYWSPHIVGELNGQHVKVAKLNGEFEWHHHDNADELFLVVDGTLRIELRDDTVVLEEGELAIVPKKVEHKPITEEEVKVLLFESAGTVNTGNVESDRTIKNPEHL